MNMRLEYHANHRSCNARRGRGNRCNKRIAMKIIKHPLTQTTTVHATHKMHATKIMPATATMHDTVKTVIEHNPFSGRSRS